MIILCSSDIHVENVYPLQVRPEKLEYIHECIVDAALAGSIKDTVTLNTALSRILTFQYNSELVPITGMHIDDNVSGLHLGYIESERTVSNHYTFIQFEFAKTMYMMLLPTKSFTHSDSLYLSYRESDESPWVNFYTAFEIDEDGITRYPVMQRMLCEYYDV